MMNFINSEPITGSKHGEIRYFSFVSPWGNKRIFISKVKCLSKRWDRTNKRYIYSCKILEVIESLHPNLIFKKGDTVIVDHKWQLQESVEASYHLIIHTLLTKGPEGYYNSDPPF